MAAAGALAVSPPGFSQAPEQQEPLTIPVGECVAIEDSLERFACYERMVETARAGNAAAAPEETARPAPRQAVSEDGFGFPATEPTSERESPPEIRSTVAAVEEPLPNLLTVTLENGQVWRQMQSQRYNLRAGHRVRIYGTRWGDSYRLSADELYGFIQVERVR